MTTDGPYVHIFDTTETFLFGDNNEKLYGQFNKTHRPTKWNEICFNKNIQNWKMMPHANVLFFFIFFFFFFLLKMLSQSPASGFWEIEWAKHTWACQQRKLTGRETSRGRYTHCEAGHHGKRGYTRRTRSLCANYKQNPQKLENPNISLVSTLRRRDVPHPELRSAVWSK